MTREELANVIVNSLGEFTRSLNKSQDDYTECLRISHDLLMICSRLVGIDFDTPAEDDDPITKPLIKEPGSDSDWGDYVDELMKMKRATGGKRYFQVIQDGPELNVVKEYVGEHTEAPANESEEPVTYYEFSDGTVCNKGLILLLFTPIDIERQNQINKVVDHFQMVELSDKDEPWYVEYRDSAVPFKYNDDEFDKKVGGNRLTYDPDSFSKRLYNGRYVKIQAPHPNRSMMRDNGQRYRNLSSGIDASLFEPNMPDAPFVFKKKEQDEEAIDTSTAAQTPETEEHS